MRTHIVGLLIVSWFLHGRCGYGQTDVAQTIMAMERAALDRWGKGDPQGFFEIMASDQTYFDPMTEKRIDGQAALKQYIAPFAGKIKIERVEMIDGALAQDRQVGDRQPRGLADLRQGVGTAPRRQPGGKQMVEQGRKLVRLLVVRLGPGTFTHGTTPSAPSLHPRAHGSFMGT